ncbi:asparagine synthase-domain-containing protein [Tribonema minus]|uniref:asparagine synthase (glutamine-hydrolyzing) n=1 Tax=Tribonema minus TaxID=303371 RepID=A0A836CEP6_9STRA|nr:asparagine synthase-domain-containing protein [Tribonema minus]
MCGLSFWFRYLAAGIDDDAIVLAARALQPRGPDGSATLKFQMTSGEPGLMCFHRLAIINRNENGMQPFRTDGARFMCTGEIYNHTQLQMDEGISEEMRSDVEVVMRMLTRDGSDEGAGVTCRRLDGDFAFVYTRGDRVIAGRDPVGVRPLFYGVKEGRVVAFASEAKALTAAGCLDDVHAFPPGCFWSSDLEGFVQYTDVYDAAPAARTAEMAMHAWIGADKSSARPYQAAVRRLLTESVRKRVDHSDRPIAFLCSGGLDSSIVVALAAEMYPHRELHAFSVEFEGAASQDAVYATELLKLLPRVEHTRVTLTEEQALTYMRDVVQVCETADVRTLRAAVPMFHLAKYISERTEYKVVLSGEGADEAFMGYFYFRMATSPEAACDEAKRLVRGLYAFDLLRADRCFAAHGLEVRVPFLDRDLLRCVFAMPAGVRHDADGGSIVEKALLREAFSDVEALERTGIIHRGKMCLSDGVGYTMVERLVHSASGSVEDDDASSAAPREPSFADEMKMYAQGQILGRSTQLAKMGERAQQLSADIQSKTAALNEVRSQIVHLQGGLAATREFAARMETLSAPPSADQLINET